MHVCECEARSFVGSACPRGFGLRSDCRHSHSHEVSLTDGVQDIAFQEEFERHFLSSWTTQLTVCELQSSEKASLAILRAVTKTSDRVITEDSSIRGSKPERSVAIVLIQGPLRLLECVCDFAACPLKIWFAFVGCLARSLWSFVSLSVLPKRDGASTPMF